jgi:hypothetical protein
LEQSLSSAYAANRAGGALTMVVRLARRVLRYIIQLAVV